MRLHKVQITTTYNSIMIQVRITFSNGEYAVVNDGKVHWFSNEISADQILYIGDVLKLKFRPEALCGVNKVCNIQDRPDALVSIMEMALAQAEADGDDELRDVAEGFLRSHYYGHDD